MNDRAGAGVMPGIVALPGLTGTDRLLAAFVAALEPHFKAAALSYPSDRALDYTQLEHLVRAALPRDGPFIVVGESFSGPIALSLALDRPPGLCAVVLAASFARFPWPPHMAAMLTPWIQFTPLGTVPKGLLDWLLLGRWSNAGHRTALGQALSEVPAPVLRFRAMQALRADLSARLKEITMPLLYLRASHDRLLPASAGRQILSAIPTAALHEIEGPHFLLQAKAEDCAQAVAEFARRIGAAGGHGQPALAGRDAPVPRQFLGFLERDISNHPERLQAVDADFVKRLRALVGHVETDLDAALPSDE
jgi:pimeloyl-ACP methyl ester carboxylesterase